MVHNVFPTLTLLVQQISIPAEVRQDKLIWSRNDTGVLSFKEAFLFKSQATNNLHWATTIWSKDVPPSKSLLCWRLMHNKISTDENLLSRGCALPSMYLNCNKTFESSFHLFFECDFARKLWCWFAGILNINIQFASLEDIWKLCDRN